MYCLGFEKERERIGSKKGGIKFIRYVSGLNNLLCPVNRMGFLFLVIFVLVRIVKC